MFTFPQNYYYLPILHVVNYFFCVLSFLFLCKHLAPQSVGASLAGVLPLTLYIKHLDQELNTIGRQEIFIDYNMSITPLKSIFKKGKGL